MQPEIMPAMEQAVATVMLPRPPASREEKIMFQSFFPAHRGRLLPLSAASFFPSMNRAGRLTIMDRMIAMEAENCSVRVLVATSQTSTTRGSSR